MRPAKSIKSGRARKATMKPVASAAALLRIDAERRTSGPYDFACTQGVIA
jgi:hypothetical protein